MKVIGLTGSIAMGKSETARIFRSLGIPVFNSDEAVHKLYQRNGEAVVLIEALAPEAIENHAVNRTLLSKEIARNPQLLKSIEATVHPIIRRLQREFIAEQDKAGHDVVVLDIPLLFETDQALSVDVVVVASAPAETQWKRAMERDGMSEQKLRFILSRQIADSEKRERADYIVDTSKGIAAAREQVAAILNDIRT